MEKILGKTSEKNGELVHRIKPFLNLEIGMGTHQMENFLFMYLTTSDIRKDLKDAGFLLERDVLRSRVAEESQMVKDFSDECRFWIARKPEPKS